MYVMEQGEPHVLNSRSEPFVSIDTSQTIVRVWITGHGLYALFRSIRDVYGFRRQNACFFYILRSPYKLHGWAPVANLQVQLQR